MRPVDDQHGMEWDRCDRCREAMSAALDGEAAKDAAAEQAAVDAHLAGCPDCRAWQQDAAHVTAITRRARTGLATGGPDLVARVVDHAPGPRARWRGTAARAGLAAVGVAQATIGLVSLLGAVTHAHAMTDPLMVLGAGIAHATHESAAWNLALGVAFLAGALWSRHLAGLLPALGAFIAVLAVVSGLDLVAGRVDPARVATHLLLVAGFVLGLAVVRTVPRPGPGPTPGARWWRRDERGAPDGHAPAVADRWERESDVA
ncbi:zf-HC2 domain-containing protein [Actinomycetospora cinnamomea]|uniref:Putative anti-sigma-YlaC factor YlaD n=1 Tax=Actinomycetospora cinnamomea TaxID=663609 RepID=A0A2U1EVC2_9PSEU|nr:zf-HC2 domain-containing protein [Actinomycetospora cinnamomea]PVZ03894.1 putative anti-sigma-YlaC factor YlaD [Actinomycetospora cinnamomea]